MNPPYPYDIYDAWSPLVEWKNKRSKDLFFCLVNLLKLFGVMSTLEWLFVNAAGKIQILFLLTLRFFSGKNAPICL